MRNAGPRLFAGASWPAAYGGSNVSARAAADRTMLSRFRDYFFGCASRKSNTFRMFSAVRMNGVM